MKIKMMKNFQFESDYSQNEINLNNFSTKRASTRVEKFQVYVFRLFPFDSVQFAERNAEVE